MGTRYTVKFVSDDLDLLQHELDMIAIHGRVVNVLWRPAQYTTESHDDGGATVTDQPAGYVVISELGS